MSEHINSLAADGWMVQRIMDHLIKSFEEFLSNEPENAVDYLDAFMGAHNFHARIVLDIEMRTNDTDQMWRKAAVDTFKIAMDTKPPLKKD